MTAFPTFSAALPGAPGQIVILNGTPRSGKSSIAAAIQNTFEGVWMIRQRLEHGPPPSAFQRLAAFAANST